MTAATPLTFRHEPRAADVARIREIVDATGFFFAEESNVAIELLDDRLARGPASDYRFLIAELDGGIVGYTAYGRVPLTRSSWDVYWLAVDPAAQGRGIGAALFAETERLIALAGGERIYLETSGRAQYQPTRRFYERRAYVIAATLPDFYAPGDAKVILVKPVGTGAANAAAATTGA